MVLELFMASVGPAGEEGMMKFKLAVWLGIFLIILLLGSDAAEAGAGGSIQVVSIDHAYQTITVDFDLLCIPDYACAGEIHWGDGGVSPVDAADDVLDISHTYSETGCYLIQLYVVNYFTAEEAWYSAGWQRLGYGAVCQPPSGTIDVIGFAGAPYSVMFDVTWEDGLPTVLFGDANAEWGSNQVIGSEALSYTYAAPGTYHASLTIAGAETTTVDSLCVQVFYSYALEVPCKNICLPLVVKQ
jgi:hypothetical protein